MRKKTVVPNGGAIASMRSERGWSQHEFREKLNFKVGLRTLQRAEKGEPIGESHIRQMAQTLGVNAECLTMPNQPIRQLGDNREIIRLKEPATGRELFSQIPDSPEHIEFIYEINPGTKEEAAPYSNLASAIKHFSGSNSDEVSVPEVIAGLNQAIKEIHAVKGRLFSGVYTQRLFTDDPPYEYEDVQFFNRTIHHSKHLILKFDDSTSLKVFELERDVGLTLQAHRKMIAEYLGQVIPYRKNYAIHSNNPDDYLIEPSEADFSL